jgi:hypothetical protein
VQQLNGSLQKTALGHLAGMKFEKPIVLHCPREWLGIVARRDFDHLQRAQEDIIAGIGDVRVARSQSGSL